MDPEENCSTIGPFRDVTEPMELDLGLIRNIGDPSGNSDVTKLMQTLPKGTLRDVHCRRDWIIPPDSTEPKVLH